MDFNFSLDRVESGADVDSMIQTFTEVILGARAAAVPLVCPSRFCLALFPQIKSIIAQKWMAAVIPLAQGSNLNSDQSVSVQDSCSALNSDVFTDDFSPYTSPREIKNIIKKLRNGKAPGCDDVPNILLKNIPRRVTVFLTYIYTVFA
jgi:hypothetical protein